MVYLNLNLLFSIGFACVIIKAGRIRNPNTRYFVWSLVIARFIYDLIFYEANTSIPGKLPKHGVLTIGINVIHESCGALKTIFASLWLNNVKFSSGDIVVTLVGPEITLYMSFVLFAAGVYLFAKKLTGYFFFKSVLFNTLTFYKEIKGINIYLSDYVNTPFVSGIIKPYVILPLSFIYYCNEQELNSVINHELSHVKRRDHIIFIVLSFLKSLFFGIFPLHFVVSRLEEAEEQICDRMIIEGGGERLTVANALMRLVEFQSFMPLKNVQPYAVPGFLRHKDIIKNRLNNLYSENKANNRILAIPFYIFSFILIFGCSIF